MMMMMMMMMMMRRKRRRKEERLQWRGGERDTGRILSESCVYFNPDHSKLLIIVSLLPVEK
jgi:hypothetical protein